MNSKCDKSIEIKQMACSRVAKEQKKAQKATKKPAAAPAPKAKAAKQPAQKAAKQTQKAAPRVGGKR